MQPTINSLATLSDLFKEVDGHYRLFDLGCRLSKLSVKDFNEFELGHKPYELPWLKHAWIGILLWQTEQQHAAPTIWFLKFPLDEQGYLIQASRDEFLNQLLDTIGTNMLDQKQSAAMADKLQHSNLAFTPDQDRMAAFNAQAKALLKQPASDYYIPVRDYIMASGHAEGWQDLGLQGFADLVSRVPDNAALAKAVAASIANLPSAVMSGLAVQCENVVLPYSVSQAFIQRGQMSTDAGEQVACLRAVSQAPNAQERQAWLLQMLAAGQEVGVELLAAVASKCQTDLRQDAVLAAFVEACAAEQGVFNGLVGELMYQQDLRQAILALVRSSARSQRLALAFGQFLQA